MQKEMRATPPSGQLTRRLTWRRILVPIDFSKTSLRALEVAVPLARDHAAELLLFFAVEPDPYASGMEGVIIALPDRNLMEDAKAKLSKIAKRMIPPSVEVATLVIRGRAFDTITRVARQKEIDLIVLTTHGRTGLKRVLLGSTAERVVRHADCPVYVVRSFGQNQRKRQRKD